MKLLVVQFHFDVLNLQMNEIILAYGLQLISLSFKMLVGICEYNVV
jgi:hypothetical protein